MRRYLSALYLSLCLLSLRPAVALAHQGHGITDHYINPPDWLGWFIAILALVLPVILSIRIRGGR